MPTTGSLMVLPKMMGVTLVTANPTNENAAMQKGRPSAWPAQRTLRAPFPAAAPCTS